ncbi:aminotransferase class I/II-fold pyridoxal phosphate-dependent enzyme [bacterium]|nr:aminotransferase class I/II-fold pyridoxal phosphate-dependent enzyme [bacterium]
MKIYNCIKKNKNKFSLFTTPSHDGKFYILHKFYQWYKLDVSEIDAIEPEKALIQAELDAAKIYGTKYTKFLTNGSSSGVISAILASNPKKILIWDKAHSCHKNGAKLTNATIIEYSLPYDNDLGVYRSITLDMVNSLLEEHQPDTLIITSPTYEGFVADIIGIKNLCAKHNTILIVDEAHGALYPFSDRLPLSAVKYADFTIQSLHKTAGGINPTALLHSNNIDPTEALKMISTTSPSYPMLASIEANIRFLNSARGRKYINNLINNIEELNLPKLNDDITKILVKGGNKLSELIFDKYNIEDERANEQTLMFLCGIGTDKKKLDKLKHALKNIGF